MFKKLFRIIIALAALLHLTSANYYQVAILLEMQYPPGNSIHRCNGAIVYEKLVIAPASCVHLKIGSNKPIKLDPSVLSIVAGSTNAFLDALRVNVSAINIAENFNPETLENDLALLTLSQSLPLGTRPDMKWIMLDDNVHINHSCLANFFSRNSKAAVPNYYQTEELTMYNNEICRNFTKYPHARKDDICSIYVLPQQMDCAAADSYLAFNSDLGTGLVCKSYLVGLLSSVVSRPDPKNNCTDVTLAAIYTNIFPHLMWVYSIMANIETEFTSTPYDASVKSLVINTTNDKEFLTTTISPLTTVNITTQLNSTTSNSTTDSPISNSTPSNSTITNSTITNSITNSTTTNSTTPNSTTGNSTTTNSTIWNPSKPNSTAANSTVTNSTTVSPIAANSTGTNSPISPPISLNSTTPNCTTVNSTTTNTTTLAPPTVFPNVRPIGTKPTGSPTSGIIPNESAYTSSTDSYVKEPPQTVRNFFKNSSTSIHFSACSLLIALVSLRFINIYH